MMSMTGNRSRTCVSLLALCGLVAVLTGYAALYAGGKTEGDGSSVEVMDISDDESVSSGESFKSWMKQRGWESEFGSPEYFSVKDGALHMVSKPGPIYRDRYSLAVFNRQKLIDGMENKVLLRVAGEPELRLDPEEYPIVHFRMTPLDLPKESADLQNPSKNDSAFYLLVGFDTERHEFEGREMPETVAYVWANRRWDGPVGKDSDYSAFLRYIPIGQGDVGLGEPHEVVRNVRQDYRRAFPEKKDEEVPDIIKVGLMIDSNTVGGGAESAVNWIRFRKDRPTEKGQGDGEGS